MQLIQRTMDGDMFAPLVLGDGRACGLELMRIVDVGPAPDTERRRHPRLALSLPVRIFRRSAARPTDSRTRNVSSQGFYCLVDEPFTVRESIRCVLDLPSFDPLHRNRTITLDCQARVVRVETLGTSGYGIACCIEAYHVMQFHTHDSLDVPV